MPRPVRELDVWGLPNCTTCQKVLAQLATEGVRVRRFRDLKAEPPNRAEVLEAARRVGGVERLFSRRARLYRARGLDRRELSEKEMVDLMVEHYTFLTRPVLLPTGGEAALCGGAPRALEKFVGTLRSE